MESALGGHTTSSNLPTTSRAFDTSYNGDHRDARERLKKEVEYRRYLLGHHRKRR